MIDRRTFLRSATGVAAFGGMGVMPPPSTAAPAIAVDLASLIEAHRQAYSALDGFNDTIAAAERAFYRDRTDERARQAKDEAHDMQQALLSAEKAAFLALLAYPVSTLEELRAVVAVGRTTWWEQDTISDEEADALLVGIIGKGA